MMEKKYNGIHDDPLVDSFDKLLDMTQALLPFDPTPREIKHVVLDADDTMWQIKPWGIATSTTPVGSTDGDTLPITPSRGMFKEIPGEWRDTPTGSVQLDPTLRDTLKALKKKGIPVSIASTNTKSSIMSYLYAFHLESEFTDIEANLYEHKQQMVRKIAKRHNVDPEQMIFVDDNYDNVEGVSFCTDALSLLMGYSITRIADILEFIK